MNSNINDIRADVARLRLLGMGRVLALPTETLAESYNGTGPEFLPQKIREKLDEIARPLLPAVMVHDVDFTFSDGTRRSFLVANQHLFWNCIICACDAHPWYSWRRYALILEALALYLACHKFAWIALIQAYNKTKGKTNMKKLMILAAIAAVSMLTGCQSVFEVTKNPESVHPIQEVVKVNGQDQVVVSRYERSSGGYNGYYRAPLWSTEHIKGVKASVKTDGTFDLGIQDYQKDLSTNAVTMTREMFSGGAQLAIAIGDAYCKIAGGGAQADTVTKIVAKAYNLFKSSGGDETKATVTTDPATGTLNVSDGSTCVTCDASGNCTTETCPTGNCTIPASN